MTEAHPYPQGSPDHLHAHIETVATRLDPDRLANRVRAELRSGIPDDVYRGLILYGDGELAVDPAARETWQGFTVHFPDQELRLALVHLAAALAAGARV